MRAALPQSISKSRLHDIKRANNNRKLDRHHIALKKYMDCLSQQPKNWSSKFWTVILGSSQSIHQNLNWIFHLCVLGKTNHVLPTSNQRSRDTCAALWGRANLSDVPSWDDDSVDLLRFPRWVPAFLKQERNILRTCNVNLLWNLQVRHFKAARNGVEEVHCSLCLLWN